VRCRKSRHILSENTNREPLAVACSYLGCQAQWLASLPNLTFECGAVPFDATDRAHELDLPLLALLALVRVILHVRERPRTTCGTESWVLHWVCRLGVGEGEQGVLHGYKRKPDKSPFIERGSHERGERLMASTVDSRNEHQTP